VKGRVIRRRAAEVSECSGCKAAVRRGRPWWICKTCGKECRDKIHMAKRQGEKDVEAG
jgi:predicted amidophosphoribosyltransferase